MKQGWHSATHQEVLAHLEATPQGLHPDEAVRRTAIHGANSLVSGKKHSPFRMFFDQFTDFMILVLLGASLLSAFLGHYKDSIVILIIVVLNAVIGFIQEFRAEKAMEALKAMSSPTADVLRANQKKVIPAAELVPGDIVMLEAGRIVPADLRLMEVAQLKADESALTGESMPVEKKTEAIRAEGEIPLGDRKNMAYKGTTVTYGRGLGVVADTGMKTEFGKIAASLGSTERMPTPLQKRLTRLGKSLSWAAMVICAVVFITGMLRGEEFFLMLMTAISLAVAAIPESLPAVITISLALGAKRLVSKKALVKKLPAVETLGSVTYICTDKTGTLTLNRMRAEEFYEEGKLIQGGSVAGLSPDFLTAMALCNDATAQENGAVLGDPTEVALFEAARAGGFEKTEADKKFPRIAELPFDSERKCMTTFHKAADGKIISYTKGAAEIIFEKSTPGPLVSQSLLNPISEKMAVDGLRVLALAMRTWDALPDLKVVQDIESNLVFLGMVGIFDPPREEARKAVAACKTAGIIPVMITGDHPSTAKTIAERLGILEEGREVMAGPELAQISTEELSRRVGNIRVYARVSPDQKLKIVEALQAKGEFVAMTGDGVNDAPALKRADIGVAMGVTGTDVAKEASSMVLLDDNFATIVQAVEEGRKIYDNMRRFIKYAVTTNSAEVLIIFTAPFLGLPIPFIPIQILWINLLTDGLPGLALVAEPGEKNAMSRPPRKPDEGLFARGLGWHVLVMGALMAALTLGSQAWLIAHEYENWRSIAFTVLCFCQLAHVISIRSDTESLFKQGIFSNLPLFGAVSVTFALQLATLYVPFLNQIFETSPLSWRELGAVLLIATIVFIAVEAEKTVRRSKK
ncbi:MAG TPA: cation-translocating P-type ATPase [Candidatus Omnitrophota bacterium]|nr:cation-translocating P-type ATPase [Candidatus Omnitrophota bacterium]